MSANRRVEEWGVHTTAVARVTNCSPTLLILPEFQSWSHKGFFFLDWVFRDKSRSTHFCICRHHNNASMQWACGKYLNIQEVRHLLCIQTRTLLREGNIGTKECHARPKNCLRTLSERAPPASHAVDQRREPAALCREPYFSPA